ncbi:FAD-binding protein [bacterium]|nr:MAG: FAD-binding protein [bacterium]
MIEQSASFTQRLRAIVGDDGLLTDPQQLRLYMYDGSIERALPLAVVLPRTPEQVAALVRLCHAEGVFLTPRGAGTGLSGGSIPLCGGVVLSLARMKAILSVDTENQMATVEPGLVNLDLTRHVSPKGFQYVPDPSSQGACTIGGNVAENSGGPHTLTGGVTTNHVLELQLVLADGTQVSVGSQAPDPPGPDLVGVVCGSEGTIAIVTRIVCRIVRKAECVRTMLAAFDSCRAASEAVSAVIASGIVPTAMEMMDHPALSAIEAFSHAGYPVDAGAVLLLELEALREEVEDAAPRVVEICRAGGASEVRVARNEEEREALWKGRKKAFGAMGRIGPSYYVQDGVIPRTRLPEVLDRVEEAARKVGLRVANVFHAGDGNLHPLILFDDHDPDQAKRAIAAGEEILRACVEAGGSITGEHGVGMEKRDYMGLQFSEATLAAFTAFRDACDPGHTLNPYKLLPSGLGCAEGGKRQKTLTQMQALAERNAAIGEAY